MSTAQYRLFLANKDDEHRLWQLYSEKSRDGAIQLNLDRSPGFFEALKVEGYINGVYTVEDRNANMLAGAGIRNIRSCYINGEATSFGYLSGLRVAEHYRKSRAMAMIFAKLKEMYLEGETAGYLFSVFSSNTLAKHLLTSGKAGMPKVREVGLYETFVFKPKPIKCKKIENVVVRKCENDDLDSLVSFLNNEGRKFQFFPVYNKEDFISNYGILNKLNISNMHIAIEGNEICGCLALWDQTPFRRWKVDGYSTSIKLLRPIINVFNKVIGYPLLPKEQESFNYRILSLLCIRDNDSNMFKNLYNSVINDVMNEKNILISASFFNTSPLIKCLPKFKFSFKSTIFIGYWDKTRKEIENLNLQLPYLEAGSL